MTRAPDQDFLAFVRSQAAPLHRVAYLLSGDWHLADDLVQETLARSFRHWSRIQPASNPDAYLRRMQVNEVPGELGVPGRYRRRAVLTRGHGPGCGPGPRGPWARRVSGGRRGRRPGRCGR